MCQQLMQFCSASTRPLLIIGSLLTFLLAIAIGFTACTTNALYKDIDPTIAQSKSLGYHLQLAAAGYLTLVTLLGIYAAQYNQKHSVRVLAAATAINFILALAAIGMMPSGAEIQSSVEPRLKALVKEYDFTDKWPEMVNKSLIGRLSEVSKQQQQPDTPITMALANASNLAAQATENTRPQRAAGSAPSDSAQVSKEEATKVWDSLQCRGCCGLKSGNETWTGKIPKSCCSNATITDKEQTCKDIDLDHKQGCLELIGSTSMNFIIVLGLIALANFYLAAISGISAYQTFHYAEASQNAYN